MPTPVFDRVVEALMLAAHAYPFLLMGGGMTFVGLLAVGPRKDISELWICLPAGLALLGVFAGLPYWVWWRVPRLTVTRFAFDGSVVVIEAPARGCFTVPTRALRSMSESCGRRGLLGWWLRFEGVGTVFLHVSTPNAVQLVQEVQAVASCERLTSRERSTRSSTEL
jgi:hypothetical protein